MFEDDVPYLVLASFPNRTLFLQGSDQGYNNILDNKWKVLKERTHKSFSIEIDVNKLFSINIA